MKLLITGGAGFIGSNFIRLMLEKYPAYKIINLDKLTYAANTETIKEFSGIANYTFVRGDICDSKLVRRLVSKVDTVINFAAETHVDRSILGADTFIETNYWGTYNLLEAARHAHIKRFIQISTDEVYGSINSGKFKETSLLSPNSPYSASKAAADLLARSYFITHKVPVIITRSSNNFGPYQYPEKVIPLFVTNALENQPLPLYGSGTNVRDWIYVKDNCLAIERVLHRGKTGEIYNIGGGKELKNLELTRMILNLMGKPQSLIRKVSDRPGHDFRYALDCSKIRSRLGWHTKYDFSTSIKETIEWYKSNRSWWEKLKNKSFKSYYNRQYKTIK